MPQAQPLRHHLIVARQSAQARLCPARLMNQPNECVAHEAQRLSSTRGAIGLEASSKPRLHAINDVRGVDPKVLEPLGRE